ncbi:MAG: hypothetical protein SGJ02_01360 [bacterium]|nr:hypothetical protein [bacterium]
MNHGFLSICILIVFMAVGARIALTAIRRAAEDVLWDLRDEDAVPVVQVISTNSKYKKPAKNSSKENTKNISGFIFNDELARTGLIELSERKWFQIQQKLIPIVSASFVLIFAIVAGIKTFFGVFIFTTLGLAIGLVINRYRLRSKREKYLKSLLFYLPMVMERIVMAVQAGLDIIPAITVAVNTSQDIDNDFQENQNVDPITKLLKIAVKLTNSGLGFEKSLKELAAVTESSAVRHSFLHLAVAQKEGGLLIMPLRELSDSTQLYYQESIEEEIAQMPVKATMPLMCTFAGLLLCFLTPPFLQVLSVLTNSVPTR